MFFEQNHIPQPVSESKRASWWWSTACECCLLCYRVCAPRQAVMVLDVTIRIYPIHEALLVQIVRSMIWFWRFHGSGQCFQARCETLPQSEWQSTKSVVKTKTEHVAAKWRTGRLQTSSTKHNGKHEHLENIVRDINWNCFRRLGPSCVAYKGIELAPSTFVAFMRRGKVK